MNDKKIIEEMARLDGLKQPFYVGDKVYNKCGIVPDYPNSHDDCQRVIDGMDNDTAEKYTRALIDSCGFACNRDFIQATARKKCEAILKAYGKGEDA